MRIHFGTALFAAGLVLSAHAQNQNVIPDAQVESNVLRALAGAPDLSTQDIKTTTVYGVVTLSGAATDEASRTKAEQLASRAEGVKKVIDQLTLGGSGVSQADNSAGNNNSQAGMVLQSDGTYTAAPTDPSVQQVGPAQQPYPENGQASGQPAQQNYPRRQDYPQQQQPPYQADGTPQQNPNGGQYPPRRPMYNGPQGYAQGPAQGGQEAGRPVTVPSGALLRIRINQGLSTKHSQVGQTFDGTVLTDVTADGAVAIPRGAAVQGTVVESKDAGVLKGRGELALQLNRLMMGGQTYTLVSDTWVRDGRDKTLHTVNSAIGLGALGALIGAGAGGGAGAAIGAGVGAAAGVGSSAASQGGKVIIPPEYVLNFHLAQPAPVATVSEQEMSRLSYAAGPGNGQPAPRRGYYGPGPYYYGR